MLRITEILDNANWYDDVIGLSIQGGDFGITSGTSPKTLAVWAFPGTPGKAAFKPPVADLTFTSGTPGHMTVGAHTGVVTFVATGTSLINVAITAKSSISIQACPELHHSKTFGERLHLSPNLFYRIYR